MDYRSQLLNPISKGFVDDIVKSVIDNHDDFQSLFLLMYDEEERVAWRAGWVCSRISEKRPEWFLPTHVYQMMELTQTTKFAGLIRSCLSVLLDLNRPELFTGEFINSCFEWMISPKYPIAVQASSMKLLYQVCKIEPDLSIELKAYLETVDVNNYSVGYNSTRRRVLNDLNKCKIA
jgi:hypothetical protein